MKKLYLYLTYGGVTPFVFCAICLVLNIQAIPIFGDIKSILSSYGLIITVFMAGVHWGQQLKRDDCWSYYLPITSNIITIGNWAIYLTMPFQAILTAYIVSLIGLLIIDVKIYQADMISKSYFQTRCIVTSIVVLSLIMAGVFA